MAFPWVMTMEISNVTKNSNPVVDGRSVGQRATVLPRSGVRTRSMAATARTLTLLSLVAGLFHSAIAAQEPEDKREAAGSDFDRLFPERRNERLEVLLVAHLAAVDRVCVLSAPQKAKLTLAARGDTRKFWDRVAVARGEYLLAWGDRERMAAGWPAIRQLLDEVDSSFFTESSLFSRVIVGTLDSVQRPAYLQARRERRRFHYEARIGLAIARLELGMPLRADQRQRLVKLLLDETQPPDSFDEADIPMVLRAMSRLPERELRSILDEAQWRAVSQRLRLLSP
jgi:hypothetical protein